MNEKGSFITLSRWHRQLIKAMTLGMIVLFMFAIVIYLLYDPGEPFDRKHYVIQFIVVPTVSQITVILLFSLAVIFLEKHVSEWIMTIILSLCMTAYMGVMVGAHNSVPEMSILLIYPVFGATIYNNRLIMVMQGVLSMAVYILIKVVIVPQINNFMPVNTNHTYIIIFFGLTTGAVIVSFMLRQVSLEIINNSIQEKKLLKKAASTDQMTGLLNHSSFYEIMEEKCLDGNQKFSIIVIDIDNFKKVNDTYGHAAGDKIILKAVDVIKQNIRSNDMAFRYGGEEFVVIFDNADENTVQKIGGRIVSAFNKLENGAEFNNEYFSLSAGVAEFTKCGILASELFEAADAALYYAKSHGKNQCIKYTDIR